MCGGICSPGVMPCTLHNLFFSLKTVLIFLSLYVSYSVISLLHQLSFPQLPSFCSFPMCFYQVCSNLFVLSFSFKLLFFFFLCYIISALGQNQFSLTGRASATMLWLSYLYAMIMCNVEFQQKRCKLTGCRRLKFQHRLYIFAHIASKSRAQAV